MKLFFSGTYWPEKLWQDYGVQLPCLLVSYAELTKYKKPETQEKHLEALRAMKAAPYLPPEEWRVPKPPELLHGQMEKSYWGPSRDQFWDAQKSKWVSRKEWEAKD